MLTTVAGRRHRGVVTGVGMDFVAVGRRRRAPHARAPWPPSPTCGWPREAGGVGRPTGEGHGRARRALGEVLAQAAGQRPRWQSCAATVTVVGDLRAVGGDVLTVRTDGEPAGVVYVPLASVSEVSFLASG